MKEKAVQKTDTLLPLKKRARELEARIGHTKATLGGLVEGDPVLELTALKLEMALRIIRKNTREEGDFETARTLGKEALGLLRSLRNERVSLDQKDWFKKLPLYREVEEKMKDLLMAGGINLFDREMNESRNNGIAAGVITDALLKYASRDDNYEQTFNPGKLPSFLRFLVNLILPVFKKEHHRDPPYGLDEEVIYHAKKMKMPLSQAIHHLEEDYLPRIRKVLEQEPGTEAAVREIRLTEEKIEEYKAISLSPRARPFVPERGYYTDAYSSFTREGELLVSVPMEVVFSSGTNIQRYRELVTQEIVKNLAGKGLFPALDREYDFLKSLESGRRGNSQLPGFMLDYPLWFDYLSREIPFLENIRDEAMLKKLRALLRDRSRQDIFRYIRNKMEKERGFFITPGEL